VLIWWFDKLTWQVLTSYTLSSDLKRGRRRGWQVNLSNLVKLTSLSSGACHLRQKKKWESLARRWRCLDFSVILLGVLVCLKSVFSGGQDVKYERDTTPHLHLFNDTKSDEETNVVHRKKG